MVVTIIRIQAITQVPGMVGIIMVMTIIAITAMIVVMTSAIVISKVAIATLNIFLSIICVFHGICLNLQQIIITKRLKVCTMI